MRLESTQPSTDQLLHQIRKGDRLFLRQLYEENRSAFGVWVTKNYQCDEDMIADIYQQAFTTLYYNVKEGRLVTLTSSIRTYLFAIGKNLIRDHIKITARRQEILEVAVEMNDVDNSIIDRYQQSAVKTTVSMLLNRIGEPCKSVLELFYIKGYALDAIAVEMNYSNENVVAKRKFICLKQMRELLAEGTPGDEI